MLAAAVMREICDAGSNLFSIGLAGTEEMYWAVTEFNAFAGIEITALHNPNNHNCLKIVKSGSQPLDVLDDFQAIKLNPVSRSSDVVNSLLNHSLNRAALGST